MDKLKDFIEYHEAFWTAAFKEKPKNNNFMLVQSIFGDQFVAKYEAEEKGWYTYEENTPWSPEQIVAWRYLPKPYTGPKNERDFSESKTPYEDIAIYIEDRINGILDDYVVKIRLNGKTYTELLTYNGEYFEWLNDWYEGEKEIELLDFFPLEDAVRGKQ